VSRQVGVRPVQLLQGHEALVVHGRRVLQGACARRFDGIEWVGVKP
jgi:hypothetical protein